MFEIFLGNFKSQIKLQLKFISVSNPATVPTTLKAHDLINDLQKSPKPFNPLDPSLGAITRWCLNSILFPGIFLCVDFFGAWIPPQVVRYAHTRRRRQSRRLIISWLFRLPQLSDVLLLHGGLLCVHTLWQDKRSKKVGILCYTKVINSDLSHISFGPWNSKDYGSFWLSPPKGGKPTWTSLGWW